jgi:hypothetical protein
MLCRFDAPFEASAGTCLKSENERRGNLGVASFVPFGELLSHATGHLNISRIYILNAGKKSILFICVPAKFEIG